MIPWKWTQNIPIVIRIMLTILFKRPRCQSDGDNLDYAIHMNSNTQDVDWNSTIGGKRLEVRQARIMSRFLQRNSRIWSVQWHPRLRNPWAKMPPKKSWKGKWRKSTFSPSPFSRKWEPTQSKVSPDGNPPTKRTPLPHKTCKQPHSKLTL